MKHIRQKNDLDCGIACAAMAANCQYRKAHRLDPKPGALHGLYVAEMLVLLTRLTGKVWTVKRPKGKRLEDFSVTTGEIFLIRREGEEWGHWVTGENGVIYDPEYLKPASLENYQRRDCLVIRVLTPSPTTGSR